MIFMSNKPNEKLTNELLDTSLNEGNRLEAVQKFVKDNLFYIIAGTTLIAWVADCLHIYHREFDPVPYINKYWLFLAPVWEFIIGATLLTILWTKDAKNKVKWWILAAYIIALLCALDQGIDNQKLFDRGLIDWWNNIETLDQELMENLYYREGVEARNQEE